MTETTFTPLPALVGGLLIGIASAGVALSLGRIAGISGLFARTLLPTPGDWSWRALFLLGLVVGGGVAIRMLPSTAAFTITDSPLLLVSGGLLVGFGTQLGNGCTSGHGVCGLARLSRRSLVAVPTFIACGMLTVTLLRSIGGL